MRIESEGVNNIIAHLKFSQQGKSAWENKGMECPHCLWETTTLHAHCALLHADATCNVALERLSFSFLNSQSTLCLHTNQTNGSATGLEWAEHDHAELIISQNVVCANQMGSMHPFRAAPKTWPHVIEPLRWTEAGYSCNPCNLSTEFLKKESKRRVEDSWWAWALVCLGVSLIKKTNEDLANKFEPVCTHSKNVASCL